MSVVAVAVVIAAVVVLLLRTNQLKVGSAVVCILLGLVLGATPAGPAINQAINGAGEWLWARVTEL